MKHYVWFRVFGGGEVWVAPEDVEGVLTPPDVNDGAVLLMRSSSRIAVDHPTTWVMEQLQPKVQ
jgi:hypothetical protein